MQDYSPRLLALKLGVKYGPEDWQLMLQYSVLTYILFNNYSYYGMIYLLTAIGLTPGGSSTVHIYTQTIHRTTQLTTITTQLTRTAQLTT